MFDRSKKLMIDNGLITSGIQSKYSFSGSLQNSSSMSQEQLFQPQSLNTWRWELRNRSQLISMVKRVAVTPGTRMTGAQGPLAKARRAAFRPPLSLGIPLVQ
jgi:hypothetical protein